ncbi:hypothetical protein [Cupriavidus metallidurans]|uniref:hypothetical protein n=1 Tax=Cupriavidus metallidurans TaxID=119219 RepID=UPI001CCB8D15|nr:hypothetical protein [Cupriavidus metallidurans]UBM12810.1 hypothetical protein LAI70_28055 [Cupriavidus metallidurans]
MSEAAKPRILIVGGIGAARSATRFLETMIDKCKDAGFEVEVRQEGEVGNADYRRDPDMVIFDELSALRALDATKLIEDPEFDRAETQEQARKEWLRSLRRKKGGY